ncbi:guanitoxin biosynthesis L-enduracididine beta-hydroxylase GntD [Longimycelium tulufanense]|nr:guanitoxin biosynthesis L-enduracididine beta-hydroxylase GntD [Longimycelium tulufanense]
MLLQRTTLTDDERFAVTDLLTELSKRYQQSSAVDFLHDAAVIAHELPFGVRRALTGFRNTSTTGTSTDGTAAPAVLVLSGHTVDDSTLGPTPPHWAQGLDTTPATRQMELLLMLYGTLLGEVFGWATQQDGRLVHDVVPTQGQENEQLGSGSSATLMWHIEEAFHPHRADYVGLLCLRNPDGVATTIGGLDHRKLSAEEIRCALQRRFHIRPDNSHLPSYNSTTVARNPQWFEQVHRMDTQPEAVPILFGNAEQPFLRIDPAYMYPAPGDAEAEAVLQRVMELIDRDLDSVTLRAGDCCFIDNYRVVHGRKAFRAKYNGRDRWLKRVSVTRDLRRSIEAHVDTASRIIA